MSTCSARGCSSSIATGASFQPFPTDSVRRKLWKTAINRPKWRPSESSVLCDVSLFM